jgi:HTH-type transcriptional regulator, transcriptional repressor of NAD biosynthesis genes
MNPHSWPSSLTGLIIGKFMPPHAGHQYLIDYARQRVDQLTVILFTKTSEPIPGCLRLQWLRELYPGVHIVPIADEYPVDFNDDALWRLWIGVIRRVYPHGPDVVFSSETYGEELAHRLGARHVMVDRRREHVPISATMIRQHPLRHWDMIAPSARAYFVRRVCLLGAESTGKTTLALALARHFKTTWVPEYARQYLQAKQIPCELSDFPHIAQAQLASEDEQARLADRVLFCDTNLLATALWCKRYFGYCLPTITQMAAQRTYHLYLVCNTDIPWIDDGLRDSRHLREQMQRHFIQDLTERGLSYVMLSGPHAQRLHTAVVAVATVLRG